MLGAYYRVPVHMVKSEDAVNMIRHDYECVCFDLREVVRDLVPCPLDGLPHWLFFKDKMTLVGANGHKVRAFGGVVVGRMPDHELL
jgi:hypothetical protein